jgi:hypothetical protein
LAAEGVAVASDITLGNAYLGVANRRLFALIDFGLQVGAKVAGTETSRGWVAKLAEFNENAWPGIGFDLAERFPSVDEKKFWAQVYHDVAHGIFMRRIGNQEVTTWQSSCIGDAYVITRLLTRAVQQAVSGAWHPGDEVGGESHYVGRVDLQL